MNVLLITYSFPPAGGVGVLRALSLARYFSESGIRVDVLTARNAAAVGKDVTLLRQIPPSVHVHRSWTPDLPFALRKAIKRVLSGRGRAVDSDLQGIKPRKPSLLKSFVANLLLPDPQVGWLPFAGAAAERLIRRRKIDLVIITVPPFSCVALVGRLRRRFPLLPIVLDFRDEWLATTIHLVSFNSNPRACSLALKMEAKAVRNATVVVAASEAARVEILGRYPEEAANKFHCISNGFEPLLPTTEGTSGSFPETGKVIIHYVGTVYGSTDPRTFIQAVRELPREVRELLHFRFIGRVETDGYRDALKSLGDSVELQNFIPHASALRAMKDATYLLLITRDRLNIAAKMYDYLSSGTPILGVIHPEGDVRRLFEETRAGWWADVEDVNAIKTMLIQAVERRSTLRESFLPNIDGISSYHRRPLAQRYARLLKTVAGKAS